MSLKIIANFPDRLNEALNGITLTELAIKIGMSKQSLSAYSLGIRNPKKPTIKAISELLNVNPAWLIGYDVEKHLLKAENQPQGLSLTADVKELIECYQLCNEEDKEELLMLARHKVKKNKADESEYA